MPREKSRLDLPRPQSVRPTPYPTRNELLRLARDILDQKPQAIALVKTVVSQFQTSTLEAALNLANAYLQSLTSDAK